MNKVTIVIAHWNKKELLDRCLVSLRKTSYPSYHIVVVDNGSTDGSAEFVRASFPGVSLIALDRNHGYSRANNIGISKALEDPGTQYVLLLNNDTEILDGDWLTRLVSVADQSEQIGMAGCALVYPDGSLQHAGCRVTPYGTPGVHLAPGWKLPEQPYDVENVIGAMVLIKRRVIETIGLLDDFFSPFQAEDLDLCLRARRAGFRIVVDPRVTVRHYTSQTLKEFKDARVSFITKRNLLRLKLLHLPLLGVAQTLAHEGYIFALYVWERRDRSLPLSPGNIRLRPEWKDNAVLLASVYGSILKDVPGILRRRFRRSSRIRN